MFTKSKFHLLCLLVSLTFALSPVESSPAATEIAPAKKIRLAILPLEGKGAAEGIPEAITELLTTDIAMTGVFDLIERAHLNKIMKEQSLQMSGALDVTKATEIGKLLSAEKVLVGSIGSFSFGKVLNIRMVDVAKGNIQVADKQIARNDEQILTAASQLALNLAAYISGKSVTVAGKTVSSQSVAFSDIKVISAYGKVVEISAGSEDGIRKGERFTVYMVDKMSGKERIKGHIVSNKVSLHSTKCKAKKKFSLTQSKAIIVAGDFVRRVGE